MSDLINLIIDDKKVSVAKGTLIVEAAKSVGITIPVFCYHEKLKPVGACRMCLVELGTPKRTPDGTMATNPDGSPVIAFMPKPQTSCTTPVSEGMVVRTHSPVVLKAQKGILEFLLISHPLDCPVCDKGGECPLQDQTYMFGPGESRFVPSDKLHFVKPIDLSERIALDRERCIMCFRCVRFQDEIAGDPQIGVFERGARSEIGVVPGPWTATLQGRQAWDSNFSGNTIELCPVGALTSKEFRFRARAWEVQNTNSICPLCAVGCNLKLQVRSNQVLRILARDNDEVNEAWLCDRGRFDYAYLNENRLTEPKVRRSEILDAVGWDTAYKTVAAKLQHIVKTYGAAAVGGIVSPRMTNEDLYVFQKFMHTVVGSSNIDYRLDGASVASISMSTAIADLEQAKAILVIGSDVFNDLPLLGLRLRKVAVHGGAKLVMAYSHPVKLAREAHVWLQYGASKELAVIQALAAAAAGTLSNDQCSAAGLERQAIEAAAKLLAGQSPVILYAASLVEGGSGGAMQAALHALAAALGGTLPVDCGSRLNGLVVEGNAQGVRDMGCAPSAGGLSGHAMLAAAAAGTLKALYIMGADVLDAADQTLVKTALANVEVLIVQDMANRHLSRVVEALLPGFSFAESDGTFTNVERRVQRLRPALTPVGQMRANWQIVAGIAAAMTGTAPLGSAPLESAGQAPAGADWGYKTSADVFAEITSAVPAYSGLTYGRLGPTGLRLS